jgi:hypothetical protein
MTATPAYGFRISDTPQDGPMSRAMRADDVKGIQDILMQRFPGLRFRSGEDFSNVRDILRQQFPGLRFRTADDYNGIRDFLTKLEEVDKPTETTPVVPPATDVTGETKKEETTATLYNDYMAGLPGGVRDLVTTDYKGVRGGRLGAGNYTTASMIPGAQVQTPSVPSTPSSTPSTGGGTTTTTTYNAPVVGGNWQQYYGDYYGGDVNYGTIGGGGEGDTSAQTTTAPQRGMQPAWATSANQQPTTIQKASGGFVASTVNKGTYVAPSSAEAPAGAFAALQRVEQRQADQPGNTGVLAAAKGGQTAQAQSTLSYNEAAALLAAPGNNAKAAESALKAADKGRIELSNAARQALEQAASKNDGDKDKKK